MLCVSKRKRFEGGSDERGRGMHLGLMGNSLRPIIGQGMVYGYDVAASELIDGIFRHSVCDKVSCLYEPAQFQHEMLRRKSRKILRENDEKKIDMISEYDLLVHGLDSVSGIDVLHNVSSKFLPMIGLRESIGRPLPVTWTIHCASYPELLDSLYLPMLLAPVKSYDAMICTSTAVRRAVEAILDRSERYCGKPRRLRMATIPLGVNTEKFAPVDPRPLRDKYGIPQDAFVILWLGRFSAGDKADLYPLLVTFQRLTQRNPEKRLLLLMAGYQPVETQYIETLEQAAENLNISGQIRFLKNHDVADRQELFCLSDVFTSPVDNVQETFGITPLEAMACGVPQVVSDWDGYRDTVRHGETGFLVKTCWSQCCDDLTVRNYLPFDQGHRTKLYHYLMSQSVAVDLEEYERAFQLLLENPTLRKRMSIASRARAVAFYDWRVIVSQMDNLWEELRADAAKSSEAFCPEDMLHMDYCSDFEDYPSVFASDRDEFFRTCSEGEIEQRLCGFPKPYGVESFLNDPILLRRLLSGERLRMDDAIVSNQDYSAHQVRRSVMYLYKYGMLRRGEPQ